MPRLLRAMFALIAVNVVCIALVMVTHISDAAWNCLRFQAIDHTSLGLIDVRHGASIIEQPLVPAKYQSQITWIPVNNGLGYYYEFTSNGLHRVGIVGYANTFNFVDSGRALSTFATFYTMSPDGKYVAFNNYDPAHPIRTLTIHERTTLKQVASIVVDGNVSPKSISDVFSQPAASDWSIDNAWFAFTSYTTDALTLTLMSPRDGTTESIPLTGKNPLTRLLWSPTGTSLAILSGRPTNRLAFANLDIITYINGHWQRVNSYDVNLDSSDNLTWELADAVWNADGQTLTVLQGASIDEGLHISLLTFRADQTATPTVTDLDANARPIALTSAWLCVQDAATKQYRLVPLGSGQSSVELVTSCLSPYLSTDKASLLLKRPASVSAASTWVGLTTPPFTLTPLSLPAAVSDNLAWSADSRYLIVRVPGVQIKPDQIVGQIGLLDSTTWQWSLVPQKADLVLPATVSPDSSRFTMWAESGDTLLLLDTANHLLAELPIDTPYDFSVNIGWSPDSQLLLVSRINASGLTMISLFDRDGHELKTFRQPAEYETWLGGYLDPSWSRCEPASKLRT